MQVVIAARDEAARIGATIAAIGLALPRAGVWVADDCSRDATPDIARALRARVVRAERHIGKGAAMSAAAAAALAELREPDGVVLLCDADLGASAARLGALVGAVAAGKAELAIGAFGRPRGGGLGAAIGFARWAVARRCGRPLRAPISGQRALSGRSLALLLPFAAGYGMELAMTIDALRAGLVVRELELDLTHRAGGCTPAGFAHRALQLGDMLAAAHSRA